MKISEKLELTKSDCIDVEGGTIPIDEEIFFLFSPNKGEESAYYTSRVLKRGKNSKKELVENGMGIRLSKKTAKKLALQLLKMLGEK